MKASISLIVEQDDALAGEILLLTNSLPVITALKRFIAGPLQEVVKKSAELAEREALLQKNLLEEGPNKPGPRAVKVFVQAVAESSPFWEAVKPGDIYESSKAASLALGYKHNALGLQLSAGVPAVTLKGVTLSKVTEVKA